jgi:hypothetical protein
MVIIHVLALLLHKFSCLKQWSAILLLVIVMAQTFSKCWVVVSFAINQRTIAATLCENRAKANSTCQGKCYLRKKMAAQQKQESAPLNGGKEKFEVLLFNELSEEMNIEPFTMIATHIPTYRMATLQQEAAAIFHPPRA